MKSMKFRRAIAQVIAILFLIQSCNFPSPPPTLSPSPMTDTPIAPPHPVELPMRTSTPIAPPTIAASQTAEATTAPPTDTPIVPPTIPAFPLTPIAPPTFPPTQPPAPLPNNRSKPEDFVNWYFKRVTTARDYENIWGYMTERFKQKGTPGGINDYIRWWDSVESVDVNNISYKEDTGGTLHYLISLTFHMKSGKSASGDYNYYVVFNENLGHWQFDRP